MNSAVAGDALGAEGLGLHGWPLDHEPALRPGRHDHGVLDDLRLHQPEHLRAEVLPPIAPAEAAPGDHPVAQVHALDTRRADPDLVLRARCGQVGHECAVASLNASTGRWPPSSAGRYRVRPHRGVDQGDHRPQRAVVVEAGHGVERLGRRRRVAVREQVLRTVDEERVEAAGEQVDQLGADRRPPAQRRLDVRLTEGEADLAEVAGVGPQDLDLPGSEAAEQDEAVQRVDLDRPGVRGDERALHLVAQLVGEHHPRIDGDADVVQADRTRAVGPERERTLVEGPEAELVEQREEVGEGQRSAPRRSYTRKRRSFGAASAKRSMAVSIVAGRSPSASRWTRSTAAVAGQFSSS